MPFVRIDVPHDLHPTERGLVSSAVHDAMVATIGIPADDRFQIIASSAERVYDRHYLGIERSDHTIFISITLRKGRAVEKKQALYAEIARLAHERAKIAPADIFVVLTENDGPDWSFGGGLAQYAPA